MTVMATRRTEAPQQNTAPDTGEQRLRALAFWVGHHQLSEPAPSIGPAAERQRREQERDARVRELESMVPELTRLASDKSAYVRTTAAKSFAILAQAGRAPADRKVWATLLTLAADSDPVVAGAADEALSAFERYGTLAASSTRPAS